MYLLFYCYMNKKSPCLKCIVLNIQFNGFCFMHVSVHIVFNFTYLTLVSFVFLCLIFYPTNVNVGSSLFVNNKFCFSFYF